MLTPPQTASCSLWQAIPTVRVDVKSARKENRNMVKHGWQVRVMVLTLVAAWALAPLGPPAEAQVSTRDLLGFGREIAGVYVGSRPPEAGSSRLLTLSADGILSSIQSIQFSGGAGSLGFSNQQGVWRRTGDETVSAQVLDIAYDIATGAFAGMTVATYKLTFLEERQRVQGTVTGKIYPVGADPLHPGSVDPSAEFEDTFEATRVRVP
jgi:hypothetical protein